MRDLEEILVGIIQTSWSSKNIMPGASNSKHTKNTPLNFFDSFKTSPTVVNGTFGRKHSSRETSEKMLPGVPHIRQQSCSNKVVPALKTTANFGPPKKDDDSSKVSQESIMAFINKSVGESGS